jgi:hypothetical protein
MNGEYPSKHPLCYGDTLPMSATLRIESVPIETLAAFLEAAEAHPTEDPELLASFAGFSARTAKRAVPSLETLGLLKRDQNGVFRVIASGVRRGMGLEAASLVIRKALQGFRPFEMLCEGLVLGESEAEATRKTALILGLHNGGAAKLEILLRWGGDLGILESAANGYRLVAELQPSESEKEAILKSSDLESEAKARLYNSRRLGREANNALDETDRALLADALLAYETNPRKSVNDSGQAFEDYLRELANSKGLAAEAAKANGVGQLANLLYTKGVIHSHHQKQADAISTVRNATAHRKDKKTLSPWEITPLGAFTAHSLTLATIRSIHEYTTTGKQTL